MNPAASRVSRKPLQAGRGQLPLGALERVPPGDGGVVEQRRQAGVQGRPPQLDRRGVGVVGQRPDRRLGHLDPAGRLRRWRSPSRRPRPGVSSGGTSPPRRGTTTWASPVRSRTTRNVSWASSRRRCTQPCRRTVEPGSAAGRSVQSVRSGVRDVMTTSSGRKALEVWAGARSRCHHTFADVSSASRRYAGRADPGFSMSARVVRPHRGREMVGRVAVSRLESWWPSRLNHRTRVKAASGTRRRGGS